MLGMADIVPRVKELNREVVRCTKCPRLVDYLNETKRRFPDFWCKPVPSRGSRRARVVVVGLAPGLRGANRTGRMFSGDASGQWVNRAEPLLSSCFITAAARCVPPGNKPTRDELDRCRPFLARELRAIRPRVVLALGRIAHDAVLKVFGLKLAAHPFGHSAVHRLERVILVDSYHPSRQNTNTGVLTRRMFHSVFRKANRLSGVSNC